jgi:uncharacterized membrane protein required for colicin V production
MIWDLVILGLLFTFAVAGWVSGLLNNWRTPVSMLAATVCTRSIYIYVSVFLDEQTRLSGESAVFLGYVLIWLTVAAASDFLLLLFFPAKRSRARNLPDKFGGAIIGFLKGLCLLTFATLASICSVDFPNPPSYPAIARWVATTSAESTLLKHLEHLAVRLPERVVSAVISVGASNWTPTFTDASPVDAHPETTRRFRELFKALHELQGELDSDI